MTLWREKFSFYAKIEEQLILFIICAENFSVDTGILELKFFIFWYHGKQNPSSATCKAKSLLESKPFPAGIFSL